jgi:hypothetical protein
MLSLGWELDLFLQLTVSQLRIRMLRWLIRCLYKPLKVCRLANKIAPSEVEKGEGETVLEEKA